MSVVFFVLTRIGKIVYSTPHENVSSLRERIPMTITLRSAPAIEQISSIGTAEKLDLELDFVRASLPARTRLTHPHLLLSPMNYEPKYAYPLLVWLHSTGEDERQLTRIMPVISLQNYAAVAPRGWLIEQPTCSPIFDLSVTAILHRPKKLYDWVLSDENLSTSEQRIFDCIAVAQERCNIADSRIFIAGFGTGGSAALRLATLYPECFAGGAAFGAEISEDSHICPSWHTSQPLSLLLGIDKSTSEHACSMMELCYTSGLSVEIKEYPDTKRLTSTMLLDLNRWMMQIVCQQKTLCS